MLYIRAEKQTSHITDNKLNKWPKIFPKYLVPLKFTCRLQRDSPMSPFKCPARSFDPRYVRISVTTHLFGNGAEMCHFSIRIRIKVRRRRKKVMLWHWLLTASCKWPKKSCWQNSRRRVNVTERNGQQKRRRNEMNERTRVFDDSIN